MPDPINHIVTEGPTNNWSPAYGGYYDQQLLDEIAEFDKWRDVELDPGSAEAMKQHRRECEAEVNSRKQRGLWELGETP